MPIAQGPQLWVIACHFHIHFSETQHMMEKKGFVSTPFLTGNFEKEPTCYCFRLSFFHHFPSKSSNPRLLYDINHGRYQQFLFQQLVLLSCRQNGIFWTLFGQSLNDRWIDKVVNEIKKNYPQNSGRKTFRRVLSPHQR